MKGQGHASGDAPAVIPKPPKGPAAGSLSPIADQPGWFRSRLPRSPITKKFLGADPNYVTSEEDT